MIRQTVQSARATIGVLGTQYLRNFLGTKFSENGWFRESIERNETFFLLTPLGVFITPALRRHRIQRTLWNGNAGHPESWNWRARTSARVRAWQFVESKKTNAFMKARVFWFPSSGRHIGRRCFGSVYWRKGPGNGSEANEVEKYRVLWIGAGKLRKDVDDLNDWKFRGKCKV